MSDDVERFELEGMTARIMQDTDCSDPRENDNLGRMICWHRNYKLGDKHEYSSPDEFQQSEEYKNAAVCLPLYLYDHSGITMRVGHGFADVDPGEWDSGQVGWIVISPEKVRKEYSVKRIGPKLRELVSQYLRNEVQEYASYLEGDCYGYVIENADGENVNSSWGFIGYEYVKEEAESVLKAAVEGAKRKAVEESREDLEQYNYNAL